MEFIPFHDIGVDVPNDYQAQIMNHLKNALNPATSKKDPTLPLTKSTPLMRSSLNYIAQQDYFVQERPEGQRCMLLLVQNGGYLVNSLYEMRYVYLFCPNSKRPDQVNVRQTHHWTILDGIVVKNADKGTTYRFMIADILMLNMVLTIKDQFTVRLKNIQNQIITPRKSMAKPPDFPEETLQLQLQDAYPVQKIGYVLRSMRRSSSGLIFVPRPMMYTCDRNRQLFEWKPANCTRAHFEISIEWKGRPPTAGFKMQILEHRTLRFYDWLTLSEEHYEAYSRDKKSISGVIECIFDPDWLTFIPLHGNTWENGNPEYQHATRGAGWRMGGWRFIRLAHQVREPLDNSEITRVQAALQDNLRLEEFESIFPDDPVKSQALIRQRQEQQDANSSSALQQRIKASHGQGVCYDYQNKGACARDTACPFSHCACSNVCACTLENHTHGKRKMKRSTSQEEGQVTMTAISEKKSSIGKHSSDTTTTTGFSSESSPAKSTSKLKSKSKSTGNSSSSSLLPSPERMMEELEDSPPPSPKKIRFTLIAPIQSADREVIQERRKIQTEAGIKEIWHKMNLGRSRSRRSPYGLLITEDGRLKIEARAVHRD